MERVKIHIEYLLRASPAILYQFFTSPSCLIQWFCDSVDVQGDNIYTFSWSGSDEIAKLTEEVEDELVHYAWLEDRLGEFTEFRISVSGVTGNTVLEIIDFCDKDDIKGQTELWHSQIRELKKVTGIGDAL